MNDLLSWPATLCLLTLFAGAACSSSSSTPACGGQGQACCNLVTCSGDLVCLSGICAVSGSSGPSGGSNGGTQTNTTTGSSTRGTTGPTASTSGNATGTTGSSTCGAESEVCCSGVTCNGSLVCQNDTCTQPQSGVAGTPCTKNADCPTGICVRTGQPAGSQPAGEAAWTGDVCSTTCTSAADCVAG